MHTTWTLIVVEDDALLLRAIASFAREELSAFTHVHAAQSFEEALRIVDGIPQEDSARLLVLSDYNLSHADRTGLHILRYARSRHPACVCVLMSGEDRSSLPRDLETFGVDTFLEKPFLFHVLDEIVNVRMVAV